MILRWLAREISDSSLDIVNSVKQHPRKLDLELVLTCIWVHSLQILCSLHSRYSISFALQQYETLIRHAGSLDRMRTAKVKIAVDDTGSKIVCNKSIILLQSLTLIVAGFGQFQQQRETESSRRIV